MRNPFEIIEETRSANRMLGNRHPLPARRRTSVAATPESGSVLFDVPGQVSIESDGAAIRHRRRTKIADSASENAATQAARSSVVADCSSIDDPGSSRRSVSMSAARRDVDNGDRVPGPDAALTMPCRSGEVWRLVRRRSMVSLIGCSARRSARRPLRTRVFRFRRRCESHTARCAGRARTDCLSSTCPSG